jgi:hypothetical protein
VTLCDLARAFDVGLEVRFESFVGMLQKTWKPSAEARNVPSFEEEAATVDFYTGVRAMAPAPRARSNVEPIRVSLGATGRSGSRMLLTSLQYGPVVEATSQLMEESEA